MSKVNNLRFLAQKELICLEGALNNVKTETVHLKEKIFFPATMVAIATAFSAGYLIFKKSPKCIVASAPSMPYWLSLFGTPAISLFLGNILRSFLDQNHSVQ